MKENVCRNPRAIARFIERMVLSPDQNPPEVTPLSAKARYDCLEIYAEQDAIFGRPNPRYKQSSIYCNTYLECRVQLVGTDGLTDEEWDLTIF